MTKFSIIAALSLFALANAQPSPLEKREVLRALPENADNIERQFQPYLDFDKDGCYQTAAVDSSGKRNAGLKTSGALNGNCRDARQLDNSNTYSRRRCNNGVCGIVYEYYYEKDQTTNGCCGHRHDFENVVVFTRGNQVLRVAPSCHGKYNSARSSGFPLADGTHPLIVYHKDGASTHCHRFANNDDIARPENVKGRFWRAPLVGWWGFPNTGVRDSMNNADWGAASPKTSDKDSRFANALKDAGAASVGLNPYGPDN